MVLFMLLHVLKQFVENSGATAQPEQMKKKAHTPMRTQRKTITPFVNKQMTHKKFAKMSRVHNIVPCDCCTIYKVNRALFFVCVCFSFQSHFLSLFVPPFCALTFPFSLFVAISFRFVCVLFAIQTSKRMNAKLFSSRPERAERKAFATRITFDMEKQQPQHLN